MAILGTDQLLIERGGVHYRAPVSDIPSGSDPWTYVKLTTAALNTTTTSADTLLAFIPAANTHYLFESCLFIQSAATTTGVQIGLKWPTSGTNQEAAWAMVPTSATAFVSRFWGAPTVAKVAATAVAIANEGFFAKIDGQFVTTASPVGNLIITLASEVAASEARIMQNSWIRYRTI
jgi:hypothetical protein